VGCKAHVRKNRVLSPSYLGEEPLKKKIEFESKSESERERQKRVGSGKEENYIITFPPPPLLL
jgi:hypothetical protein